MPWVEARQAGDVEAMERVGEDYQAALRVMVRHHERTGDDLFGRALPQILLLHAMEVSAAQLPERVAAACGIEAATVVRLAMSEYARRMEEAIRDAPGSWARWEPLFEGSGPFRVAAAGERLDRVLGKPR